jgi:hypothetical protein
MRSLVRIAAPVVAAVAIALGGASSALAASRAPSHWSPPPASAPVAKAPVTWSPPPASAPALKDASPGWSVNDAWCNGDDAFMTCFVVTGRVQFLIGAGTSGIVINVRTDATHYEQGVLVSADTELSHERFAETAAGVYTVHVVTHTRVIDGDGSCSFQEVFRIVDFEVVTDHDAGTCA